MTTDNIIPFATFRTPAPQPSFDEMANLVSRLAEGVRNYLDRKMPLAQISSTTLDMGSYDDGSRWASFLVEARLPSGIRAGLAVGFEGRDFSIVDADENDVAVGPTFNLPEASRDCATSIENQLLADLRKSNDGALLGFDDSLSICVMGSGQWLTFLPSISKLTSVANLMGRSGSTDGGGVPVLYFGKHGLCLEPLNFGFEDDVAGTVEFRRQVGNHSIGRKCVAMLSGIDAGGSSLFPKSSPTFVAGMWRPEKSKPARFVFLGTQASAPFGRYPSLQPIFVDAKDVISFLDPVKPAGKFYRPSPFQSHSWSANPSG